MAVETARGSPLTMDDVLTSPVYRDLMTPDLVVGDPAFPFDLPLLDPVAHAPSAHGVRLADFAGERPVVLVFGSYT